MSENLTQALLDAHQDDVYYTLTMFPYPSGYGLHAGHASVFTINDINARYQRMKGKVVLNPFGFDSFGLPTENYAMQQGKPARQVTKENGEFFLKQIAALDLSFDMDRVFYTSDPEYYKWTQWIFLKLYHAGLVYRDEKFVNRCPDCMTVLANDQVVDGLCERCKSEIIQQKHPQRFIKITEYADRLLADLDTIDRPEETKQAQRNWIGKSVGTEVDFIVQETTKITCFTTRIDTLYGVTAVVLAPENTIIDQYLSIEHKKTVLEYRKTSMSKTAVQRQQDTKDKTGVFSGIYALHPLTNEQIPVWFADYVLMEYGTGAVMFVPAHDERDREFAQVHGLEVKQVIAQHYISGNAPVAGKAVSIRHNVLCLLYNQDKTYVGCLDWKSNNRRSFVMGGVDGDDIIEAGKREIMEETGYTDIAFIEQIPGEIHAEYYAAHKDINRYSIEHCLVYQLNSDTNNGMRDGEENHDFLWIPKDETLAFLSDFPGTISSNVEYFKRYVSNNRAYTGTGKIINSEQFNGLDSLEAKKAITSHLVEIGAGKAKITYKLRDWSVSRQRYWGSPIPMYYEYETKQVPYLKFIDTDRAYRDGLPVVNRTTVRGFVYDPKTQKYCILYRKSRDIYMFPSGGIDDDETLEQGLKREILEETGYSDIKIQNIIGEYIEDFYAVPKHRNQHIQMTVFACELLSDTNDGHAREAHEDFNILWLSADEIYQLPGIPVTTMYCFKKYTGVDIDREGQYSEWIDKDKKIFHPIPESELPVVLPLDIEQYKPKGKSPLEDHESFPIYHKIPKVLFIHGRGNTQGDGSCLDVLSDIYTQKGYQCIYPQLSYAEDYDFEKAMKDVLQYDADIVVGHSAGGFLALHYASIKKTGEYILISPTCESYCDEAKKVDGTYMATGVRHKVFSDEFISKIGSRLGKEGCDKYIQFHNHNVNYNRLKNQKVQIIYGEKDELMSCSKEWYGENNQDICTLEYHGHMGSNEENKDYSDLIGCLDISDIQDGKNSVPTTHSYKRECDTLDTFMCSSFYFLRFPDAHNSDELIRREFADKLFPIDLYTGGKEHTVGHLLYSRFIHKFLYDQGYVHNPEPFAKLVHQGYILGPDGRKMGKRYGNVIDPIDVVNQYGSDAVRTYMMFMGPVDQDKVRNDNALKGIKRFLDRIIKISTDVGDGKNKHLETTVHRTIKGMTYDLEQMKYNTAVSKLMILLNVMEDTIKQGTQLSYRVLEQYALMLAPFAPKTAQFVRERTGHDGEVQKQSRPVYDPTMVVDEEVIIPVQINGKRKAELSAPVGSSEDEIMDLFHADESYTKHIGTTPIKKIIWVQDKILNIVV